MMEQVIFTKRDLRRMFDASSRTIERWVASGRLPKPILPGRWLREDVENHLANMRQTATRPKIDTSEKL